MITDKVVKAVVFASAFMLIGAGCASPFAIKQVNQTASDEEINEMDRSGESLSEQADILVDAALDEALKEEGAAGQVGDDASLFTSDESELNNLEKSYEESEL